LKCSFVYQRQVNQNHRRACRRTPTASGDRKDYLRCGQLLRERLRRQHSVEYREGQLESLAGLWWREHHNEAPPGYLGRIVLDGSLVRDEVRSIHDAVDPSTRSALLQVSLAEAKARTTSLEQQQQAAQTAAQETAARHEDLVRELHRRMSSLRTAAEDAQAASKLQAEQLHDHINSLTNRSRALQAELTEGHEKVAGLSEENESLRQVTAETQRGYEAATNVAASLRVELHAVEERARLTEQELRAIIATLQAHIRTLQVRLREVEEERDRTKLALENMAQSQGPTYRTRSYWMPEEVAVWHDEGGSSLPPPVIGA
jgi:hypothetical protein